MKINISIIISLFFALIILNSCKEDPVKIPKDMAKTYDPPTPYDLLLEPQLPIMNTPEDNPLTVEGIKLGRMLFFDPILSADSTQSCASCHQQNIGFTDKDKFSIGIDGFEGKRRAMPIVNIGYMKNLFWDGRAKGVEDQALFPVEDPLEMHNIWEDAVIAVEKSNRYTDLFGEAYGVDTVTKDRIVKSIAQFERTMVSSNSNYDEVIYENTNVFSEDAAEGYALFYDEEGADCFHCHDGGLMTDNLFHNNGIDSEFKDQGLYNVTKIEADRGKFKTPTLRNVELRGPYMHDGRFETLKDVLDHYSEGLQSSSTIDPLLKSSGIGGVHLTETEKWQVIAFLKSMTDTSFTNNPAFKSPFE